MVASPHVVAEIQCRPARWCLARSLPVAGGFVTEGAVRCNLDVYGNHFFYINTCRISESTECLLLAIAVIGRSWPEPDRARLYESTPSPRAIPLRGVGAVIEGDGVLGLGEEEPALDHQAGEGDQGGKHRAGKGQGQGG